MPANDQAVQDTVSDILSTALEVPAATVTGDFSPEQCETWDSVRHLTIVLALEEKFRISFAEGELSELSSLPKIVAAVASKLKVL